MLSGTLASARARAESLMLDAGKAERPTGETAYNPVTQRDEDVLEPLFGEDEPVRCKIQARNVVVRTEEVGDRTAATIRLELHLPVDTEALQTGDVWTVTTPHALSTVPAGTAYRINGPAEGSLKTARRYEVERLVS